MKKIIFNLLLLVMLFTVTGCIDKKVNEVKKDDENPIAVINGEKISLNYETNFNNMYYRESISLFQSSTYSKMRNISYSADGKVLFNIRMGYIENKSLIESKNELTFSTSMIKINNLDYLYGEWDYTDSSTKQVYRAHQYFYEYNNTTYTICIISNEDIQNFESVFMSNVYFK